MGNQCAYYPEPGPDGETGAGGVCPDCMDEGYASYFCSQECYEANLVSFEILSHNNGGDINAEGIGIPSRHLS